MDTVIKWEKIDLKPAFEKLNEIDREQLQIHLPEIVKLVIQHIDYLDRQGKLFNSQAANFLIIRQLNFHLGGLFLQLKKTTEVEQALQIPIDFIVGFCTEYAKEKLGEVYDYSPYV